MLVEPACDSFDLAGIKPASRKSRFTRGVCDLSRESNASNARWTTRTGCLLSQARVHGDRPFERAFDLNGAISEKPLDKVSA